MKVSRDGIPSHHGFLNTNGMILDVLGYLDSRKTLHEDLLIKSGTQGERPHKVNNHSGCAEDSPQKVNRKACCQR